MAVRSIIALVYMEVCMKYIDKTCNEYIQELSTKAPVPGGGGTSALVGAIGMALGSMVGSLTTGKKKYADVEEDIQKLMARAEEVTAELKRLTDEDAVVFAPLAKAYGMPKDTEEEKAEKDRVMESCLRDACSVPYGIMEQCCKAIDILEEFAHKGSRLAVSDAGVGAVMCKAALQGASLNVYINTKAMKDTDYASDVNVRADAMLYDYMIKADEIFDYVMGELK